MIIDRLWAAGLRHGGRVAVRAGRQALTYDGLWSVARRLAAVILDRGMAPIVGFLCERDESAYQAVLGILAAGRGYTPLNPKMPDDRLRYIAASAELDIIIVGNRQMARAQEVFGGSAATLICIATETDGFSGLNWVPLADVMAHEPVEPRRPASPKDTAYLLFTSGSTGEPKGVAVSNANLCAYVDYIVGLYRFGPDDVHSQTFELTFDLSVHDMMCAFTTGGTLVRMAGAELLSPAGIVRKHGVTSWFSVPSLAAIMARTGGLKEGGMPSLRVSLFCGEALPASIAVDWARAAPASIIENLYGPTEATIAITRYLWDPVKSPSECTHGLVPIGEAFAGQATLVLAEEGGVLRGAGRGSLLLGGSQVTGGYWKLPEMTAEKFIDVEGEPPGPWYVTGDLVERDEAGCLHFIGRMDSQIKFRGYRIELREIEGALRQVAGTELAVVIPCLRDEHEIRELVAVVSGTTREPLEILVDMRAFLPEYMIPQEVRIVETMPRNLSGKIDRGAIAAWLGDKGR